MQRTALIIMRQGPIGLLFLFPLPLRDSLGFTTGPVCLFFLFFFLFLPELISFLQFLRLSGFLFLSDLFFFFMLSLPFFISLLSLSFQLGPFGLFLFFLFFQLQNTFLFLFRLDFLSKFPGLLLFRRFLFFRLFRFLAQLGSTDLFIFFKGLLFFLFFFLLFFLFCFNRADSFSAFFFSSSFDIFASISTGASSFLSASLKTLLVSSDRSHSRAFLAASDSFFLFSN